MHCLCKQKKNGVAPVTVVVNGSGGKVVRRRGRNLTPHKSSHRVIHCRVLIVVDVLLMSLLHRRHRLILFIFEYYVIDLMWFASSNSSLASSLRTSTPTSSFSMSMRYTNLAKAEATVAKANAALQRAWAREPSGKRPP